jgi:hypothetical protein
MNHGPALVMKMHVAFLLISILQRFVTSEQAQQKLCLTLTAQTV